MSAQYIDYGKFDSWAGIVDGHNKALIEKLHSIQRHIKDLEGGYESNAAVAIRESIQAMEPKFEAYYKVVDNYAKFLRNTANAYRSIEEVNTRNASNVSVSSNQSEFL